MKGKRKGKEKGKGREGKGRRTEERRGGASARLDRPTNRSTEGRKKGRKELRRGC
jgi:hypothetical protein